METRVFLFGLAVTLAVPLCAHSRPSMVLQMATGAWISIWTMLWVEAMQRPRLEVAVRGGGKPDRTSVGAEHMYVLHVQVLNKALNKLLRLVVQRSPVPDARAVITFRSAGAGREPLPPMQGRWSNSPQAVHTIVERITGQPPVERTVIDPGRLTVAQTIHVGDPEAGALGVANRFEGESVAYGVTNDSYFTGWRPKTWSLPPGDYTVTVKVTASNCGCERDFYLHNGDRLPEGLSLRSAGKTKQS